MQIIGFLAFGFIGMTIVNYCIGGAIIGSGNITSQFNNVLMFRTVNFGIITFPVPNLSFIFNGLPHLLKWDYSFFGGNAQIISYFMYSASAAVAMMMFLAIVGIVYSRYGMRP
jgi:hypothetical protein